MDALFADLSAYGFLGAATIVSNPETKSYRRISHEGLKVLSVGWLDAEHSFPTASPDEALLETLEKFYEHRVNQTRGIHICEFCPDSRRKAEWTDCHAKTKILNKEIVLGSAEIRVPGKASILYASPDMVYHYISNHHYLPPKEFVDAAMSMKAEIAWDSVLGSKAYPG